jgi:hypothetical protein
VCNELNNVIDGMGTSRRDLFSVNEFLLDNTDMDAVNLVKGLEIFQNLFPKVY